MLRYLALAIGLFVSLSSLHAQEGQPRLCEKPLKAVTEDPLLSEAVKAAYPEIGKTKVSSSSCIQPYQAFLYEGSVVLLTLTPSEKTCRDCLAIVNAVFLQKTKDGSLARSGAQEAFAHEANFGSLTSITPIRFGRDNGLLIEGGGLSEGVGYSYLQPYVFRNFQVLPAVDDAILLSHGNCNAGGPETCTDIKGRWRADPGGRLLVSYSGKIEGRRIGGTVIYERRGDALAISSGAKLAEEINGARP